MPYDRSPRQAVPPLQTPRLRELCRKYDVRLKKALGQNLLLDDNINAIMVDAAALSEEDDVIEVGGGLGALTRRLVTSAGRVLSVEIDASFMPCLQDLFGHLPHVRLFRGDILNHNLEDIVSEFLPGPRRLKMVSNLPYYITTPVLFHFLESSPFFERLVVMTQMEVGERLVAPVGSAAYGALSIAARLYADTDLVHRVPASCFLPKPKVDSCIVRFRCCRDAPGPGLDRRFVMRVVRTAFSGRRKTLANALTRGALGLNRDQVSMFLQEAGIDPQRRPQTLSWQEYVRLSVVIQAANTA